MRAVSCTEARLEVGEVPAPQPGAGQVVIDVVRCGICGSDLHARHHCDELAGLMAETGYEDFMRSEQRVVLGHEFCGEVAGYGRGCRRRVRPGTPVVALPLLRRGGAVHAIGLSAQAPGAYAERVLVEESLMLPVPSGLPPQLAALTEPMAVAWHAVRRGEVSKRDVAIVIGCGPIGLAVISVLKARGVKAIVASDFSPGRRALAGACGADLQVDPAAGSPYENGEDRGHLTSAPAALELVVGTTEKLRRLPLPWHHVWRAAEALGAGPKRPVIFECVGVPGIIDGIVAGEGNGPLAPQPKRCGVLVGGLDPWACDWVTTRMMGVDPAAIGFLADPARAGPHAVTRVRPEDVEIVPAELATLRFDFRLPMGWRGARAAGSPAAAVR